MFDFQSIQDLYFRKKLSRDEKEKKRKEKLRIKREKTLRKLITKAAKRAESSIELWRDEYGEFAEALKGQGYKITYKDDDYYNPYRQRDEIMVVSWGVEKKSK